MSNGDNDTFSNDCTFDEAELLQRDSTVDPIYGGIIAGVSIITLVWYCFVLVNIFRLTKKLPYFLVFFSQGIGDIGFLLNSLWLAVDVIIGETNLLKDSKIYSIAMNIFARPVLFHFLFISIVRFIHARFPMTFKKMSTRKMLTSICCLIWMTICVEIGVTHSVWPPNAFVNHNITLYGFYSQDICYYLTSNYAIYLNAVNIVVGVLTFICYLGSAFELRKSSFRKSREGKLLAYCIIDFFIVFFLYALKAGLYSQIRYSDKPILLFVQVVYTCTFAISSILLPVFSDDLWQTMFPRKSPASNHINPRSGLSRNSTKRISNTARRFSTLSDVNGLAMERL